MRMRTLGANLLTLNKETLLKLTRGGEDACINTNFGSEYCCNVSAAGGNANTTQCAGSQLCGAFGGTIAR